VLIPAIDPSANNLDDFLSDRINCNALAAAVADEFGFGIIVEGTLIIACNAGVSYLANQIMERIEGIDENGLALNLEGDAQAQDRSGSRQADVLVNGRWQGTIEYGSAAASTLAPADNRFTAERVAD
jgi:hypothetical protein